MKNKFDNFNQKRMYIFSELVKRYWNKELESNSDLNKLAEEIKDKYGFSNDNLPFIMDHIRLAMGLNPTGTNHFTNELDLVKNSKEIKKPVVSKVEGVCEYCNSDECKCKDACKYESQIYNRKTGPIIINNECLECGRCITECDFGALADKIEFLPIIDLLKNNKSDVYATVAPAIAGQFGEDINLGQLRTAFKLLGFKDMIEVAMFADILTIKEAFEFNHLVKSEKDFFLTSCCCPLWFNMVRKKYPNLFTHMSPSVSPMIASGRILKELYPDIKVVFIAPCIAKKAEIKEPDLVGAIDYVLNFRELTEIFSTLNIDLKSLPSDYKDQASFAGRLYARTGGVSFSVKTVVNRLQPSRLIKLKAKKVSGVKDCKKVLDNLSQNLDIDANFIEGMGCVGGCVGGPRTNIEMELATKKVNESGEDSLIMTPFDNENVMKILKQLGIKSIDEIITNDKITNLLTRKLDN